MQALSTRGADFSRRFFCSRWGDGGWGATGQQNGSRGLLCDARLFSLKAKRLQASGGLFFECGQAQALSLTSPCRIAIGLGLPGLLCGQRLCCAALLCHQPSMLGNEALFGLACFTFQTFQFGLSRGLGFASLQGQALLFGQSCPFGR
jgi:hypothetical protein